MLPTSTFKLTIEKDCLRSQWWEWEEAMIGVCAKILHYNKLALIHTHPLGTSPQLMSMPTMMMILRRTMVLASRTTRRRSRSGDIPRWTIHTSPVTTIRILGTVHALPVARDLAGRARRGRTSRRTLWRSRPRRTRVTTPSSLPREEVSSARFALRRSCTRKGPCSTVRAGVVQVDLACGTCDRRDDACRVVFVRNCPLLTRRTLYSRRSRHFPRRTGVTRDSSVVGAERPWWTSLT